MLVATDPAYYWLLIITTLALGVYGFVAAWSLWRRTEHARVACAGILLYVITYVASAIAHLVSEEYHYRGYFDALAAPERIHNLALAVLVVGGGLVALHGAILYGLRDRPQRREATSQVDSQAEADHTRVISRMVLPVAILAIPSAMQIRALASATDADRIISVDGGMARVAFMSGWLVWVISFTAIWAASRYDVRNQFARLLIVVGAIAGIFWTTSWSGGRAIGLLMSLPILIVFWRQIPKYRHILLAAVTLVAGIRAALLTGSRSGGTSTGTDLVPLIDWQWGRFSMTSFAIETAESDGYRYGETLLAAVWTVPRGVLSLVGIPDPMPDLTSITQVSGSSILGDAGHNYIVPGMIPELYLNFGIAGVILGMCLLGVALVWVGTRLATAASSAQRLAYGYLSVLLVLQTLPAQSGAIFNYAIFTGFPLLVALWLTYVASRKRSRTRHDRELLCQN